MARVFSHGLERFRRRYHPLHQVRRFPPARWVLHRIDRLWTIRIQGIPHPVHLWLGRNLGTVLSRGLGEEREERELLIGLARANMCQTFWDVGTNYGLFTFSLRAAVPTLKVEAFEPDPDYVVLLMETLSNHGADRVRVHAVALSDREGTARFERDLLTGTTGGLVEASGRSARANEPQWNSRVIEVDASTMDAESAKLGMPDLVKIDVEGAELAALRGGYRTLRDHKPILLLECTHKQDEVRRLLEDLGYEVRDPRCATVSIAGPGMPFMALAIIPGLHRLG